MADSLIASHSLQTVFHGIVLLTVGGKYKCSMSCPLVLVQLLNDYRCCHLRLFIYITTGLFLKEEGKLMFSFDGDMHI